MSVSVFARLLPPAGGRTEAARVDTFDFYESVNGEFLRTAEIPKDRTSVSHWDDMSDAVEKEVTKALKKEKLLWECATDFRDHNDEALKDLMAIADRVVDEKADAKATSFALGELHAAGVDALFSAVRMPNSQLGQPDVYILHLGEGGIGLPTGSYYHDYAELYRAHVEKVLRDVAGIAEPDAAGAFAIEHEVCQSQWSPAEAQDPAKTANPTALDKLPKGLDWVAYMTGLGVPIEAMPTSVNVECPKSLAQGALIAKRRSPALRAYLHWRCADLLAGQMGPTPEALQFEFYKELSGQVNNREQDERRCDTLVQLLPEFVGMKFVAERPDAHKHNRDVARQLVSDVIDTMRDSFKTSKEKIPPEWMKKLDALTVQVGYPGEEDYKMSDDGKAVFVATHAAAASGKAWPSVVLTAIRKQHEVDMRRIGEPVDATCWTDMQPNAMNACFVAQTNKIVITAAILQDPVFNPNKEYASNMGGLGSVVGHELSHGFDCNGTQYNSHGKLIRKTNLRWYQAATSVVDRQAARGGVNAQLTSGENNADAAGLRLAYLTFKRMHGSTDNALNRIFFEQWARLWASKMTEKEAERKGKVDPHAPPRMRCNEVYNIDEFYSTYGITKSDKAYIAPRQRAKLWFA